MKRARKKHYDGTVFAILLADGLWAGGRVIQFPFAVFSRRFWSHQPTCQEVVECDVAFCVAVYRHALECGKWITVGRRVAPHTAEEETMMKGYFVGDMEGASKTVRVVDHRGTIEKYGRDRILAEGIGPASVWNDEHVEARLRKEVTL